MAGEQLRVTEGNARGTSLAVEAELLIGRAAPEEAGKLGDDPEISRRHARASRAANGQLTIEDLGSANGTFVNGERIDAPRALDLGDVVKMGQTLLQVTDASGGVPEPTRLGAAVPAGLEAEPDEQLLVVAGTAEGRRFTLDDELVIGRAVSGEGRLADDPELSRRHARVFRDAGGALSIEDLGSANGTFVNGERVQESLLKVGDSIRVGETTMEVTGFEQAPSAPAAAPPPPPAAAPPPPPVEAPPPPPVAAPRPARPRLHPLLLRLRPLPRRHRRRPSRLRLLRLWTRSRSAPSFPSARSSPGAVWTRSSDAATWAWSTGPRSSRFSAGSRSS